MKLLRNAPPPLLLDLAPRRRARPGALGWLLLAAGALLLLAESVDLALQRADLAERAALVDALRAERRGGVAEAGREAPDTPEARAALQAARIRLEADWGGTLAALARARGEQIAVLELAADAGRGQLRLVGQADAPDTAFAFVDRLQAAGALREVRLDSHEWVSDGGAGSVLRFVVSARWGDGA